MFQDDQMYDDIEGNEWFNLRPDEATISLPVPRDHRIHSSVEWGLENTDDSIRIIVGANTLQYLTSKQQSESSDVVTLNSLNELREFLISKMEPVPETKIYDTSDSAFSFSDIKLDGTEEKPVSGGRKGMPPKQNVRVHLSLEEDRLTLYPSRLHFELNAAQCKDPQINCGTFYVESETQLQDVAKCLVETKEKAESLDRLKLAKTVFHALEDNQWCNRTGEFVSATDRFFVEPEVAVALGVVRETDTGSLPLLPSVGFQNKGPDLCPENYQCPFTHQQYPEETMLLEVVLSTHSLENLMTDYYSQRLLNAIEKTEAQEPNLRFISPEKTMEIGQWIAKLDSNGITTVYPDRESSECHQNVILRGNRYTGELQHPISSENAAQFSKMTQDWKKYRSVNCSKPASDKTADFEQ
ncbi:hypothetical protein ACQ4M3_07695 [Leptolyngbya sp. AN03gr2]|uniref:hypothetical protein n=1 Tax=unclassified Leptolyngbya TaxID=2650499 RepID=UPI003D313F75